MVRLPRVFPGVLMLVVTVAFIGGCMPESDPSTFGIPMKTLAPVRLVPCPERVSAAAEATHCPEGSR